MSNFYTNVFISGNDVCYRGIKNGKRVKERLPFEPFLFTPSKKTTEYKTIHGKSLDRIDFPNIKEARDFIGRYNNVDNFSIYGQQTFEYCFIAENFKHEIEWNIDDLVIGWIDLEWGSEFGFVDPKDATAPITAITLKLGEEIYSFGCQPYKAPDDVRYYHCENEEELIETFLRIWSSNYPDIVTGWYSQFADIPYLVNRIERLFGKDKVKVLSPWGRVVQRTVTLMGKEHQAYTIEGVAHLDYLELYRKFTREGQAKESYKLDYICHEEIGEQKLSYAEHGSLHLLYKQDFQKFMDYNVRDVKLIKLLDNKLKLLELALTLAYDAKVNLDDVLMQTRMWDQLIHVFLWNEKIIIPPRKNQPKTPYAGAYVKVPTIGRHKWVVSFDLTSEYPKLMMMYNISPDTIIDSWSMKALGLNELLQQDISVETLLSTNVETGCLSENKVALTPNKQLFSVEHEGFLPKLLRKMFADRQMYKKKMIEAQKELEVAKENHQPTKDIKAKVARYKNLQESKKVCLNSCYGALGNEYFRWFDVRQAEAVTTAGQLSILWSMKNLNIYLNNLLQTKDYDYVIASDTDSVYLVLDKLVEKVFPNGGTDTQICDFLDKACAKQITPFIDKFYQELATYINAYEQAMIMKREKICPVGICVSGKNYIWAVLDEEGVRFSKPKIKAVGLKMIKSNTPEVARKKLKSILELIVASEQEKLQEYVADFKKEFMTLPMEEIATPTSMKGLTEYFDKTTIYKKGTSLHIKGSLLYNHFLRQKHLTDTYPLINDGEKIKYVYLRMPNPIKDHVISFPNILPKEFGLDQYIDREAQFEKGFIAPLKAVLDVLNWSVEKQSTLEGFFS